VGCHPDGALDYVPFAALRMPDRFVCDAARCRPHSGRVGAGHEQGAGSTARPPRLLLVADPVYEGDDPRLTAVQHVAVAPQASDGRALDPARRGYRRLPFTAGRQPRFRRSFRLRTLTS